MYRSRLGEGHAGGRRTLWTFGNLEGDVVADLELIESNAYELLGVKEKILRLAFARDESESTIRERFDSTGHSIASWLVREKSDYISSCISCKVHYSIKAGISQYGKIG